MNRTTIIERDPRRLEAMAGLPSGASAWTDSRGTAHVSDGRGLSGEGTSYRHARARLDWERGQLPQPTAELEAPSAWQSVRWALFWLTVLGIAGMLLRH